jgi:hypothetical protein
MLATWTSPGNCSTARPGSPRAALTGLTPSLAASPCPRVARAKPGQLGSRAALPGADLACDGGHLGLLGPIRFSTSGSTRVYGS